jgi:hypothetical protein
MSKATEELRSSAFCEGYNLALKELEETLLSTLKYLPNEQDKQTVNYLVSRVKNMSRSYYEYWEIPLKSNPFVIVFKDSLDIYHDSKKKNKK